MKIISRVEAHLRAVDDLPIAGEAQSPTVSAESLAHLLGPVLVENLGSQRKLDGLTWDSAVADAGREASAGRQVGPVTAAKLGAAILLQGPNKGWVDAHGAATTAGKDLITDTEKTMRFSRDGSRVWQNALAKLGAPTTQDILMPLNDEPLWQAEIKKSRLYGYGANTPLPKKADIVIVGSGLTGASATYHLIEEAKRRGLSVVVLESGEVCSQASGRNGGNFERMPENFKGVYAGLQEERRKYLSEFYRDKHLSEAQIAAEAEKQAVQIMNWAAENCQILGDISAKEGIDCLVQNGWLRVPETKEEEQGLSEDHKLAQSLGFQMQMLSPEEVEKRYGLKTTLQSRFSPDSGNYHPFKFVQGVFEKAIDRGIDLHTRTAVTSIKKNDDNTHVLRTSKGDIEAGTVILATNAFTSRLIEGFNEIEPFVSQISVTNHVKVTTQGITYTRQQGDDYGHELNWTRYTNDRGEARVQHLLGGGLDRATKNPDAPPRSKTVLDITLSNRDRVYPDSQAVPPERTWTGPMAFTPDRAPVVGFVEEGLLVAAGFNGYGGSYSLKAGAAVAQAALAGKLPDDFPSNLMSPDRFLKNKVPF